MPATITGPARLPDGSSPTHGRIVFRLRETDIDNPLLLPGPISANIAPDGFFNASLRGAAKGMRYSVVVEYLDDVRAKLITVDLSDIVLTEDTGTFPLLTLTTLTPPTRDTYDLHRGDTFAVIITATDSNDRPANIADARVTARLERGGARTTIGAQIVSSAGGRVQLTIEASQSAELDLGEYTLVLQFTVGDRVNTLRGKLNVI